MNDIKLPRVEYFTASILLAEKQITSSRGFFSKNVIGLLLPYGPELLGSDDIIRTEELLTMSQRDIFIHKERYILI